MEAYGRMIIAAWLRIDVDLHVSPCVEGVGRQGVGVVQVERELAVGEAAQDVRATSQTALAVGDSYHGRSIRRLEGDDGVRTEEIRVEDVLRPGQQREARIVGGAAAQGEHVDAVHGLARGVREVRLRGDRHLRAALVEVEVRVVRLCVLCVGDARDHVAPALLQLHLHALDDALGVGVNHLRGEDPCFGVVRGMVRLDAGAADVRGKRVGMSLFMPRRAIDDLKFLHVRVCRHNSLELAGKQIAAVVVRIAARPENHLVDVVGCIAW